MKTYLYRKFIGKTGVHSFPYKSLSKEFFLFLYVLANYAENSHRNASTIFTAGVPNLIKIPMSRQIAGNLPKYIILRKLLKMFVSYTVRTDRQTDIDQFFPNTS